MATERAPKFPFWMHQALEYLFGVLIAAQAIHADNEALPAVAGAVLVLLAATADGPFGAFRIVSRRAHRIVDLAAAAALGVVAVLARHEGATVVGLVAAGAVVLVMLVLRTDFRPRPVRAPRRVIAMSRRGGDPADAGRGPAGASGGRSDRIGRAAGRAAATGIRVARAVKARRDARGG